MAPSFVIGNPQRSLVRIPGSGQDKTLKPICLDVAQISSFSKSLNTIVNFNFNAPPDQPISGTLSISPLISNSNSNSVFSPNPGRNSEQLNLNNRKRSAEDDGRPSKRFVACLSPRTSYLLNNIRLSPMERRARMQLLKKEKETLKEENDQLMKQMAKFKEIIQSKSRLNEFLKSLKEMEVN